MVNSIIEGIYEFFDKCPLLSMQRKIGIDELDADLSFCVETVPCTQVIKSYTDGSAKCQYEFIFSGRELYGDNEINAENSAFYERLANWIEQSSRLGVLPRLPEGLEALEVSVQSGGYVFTSSADRARYQIQCKLLFFKEC